MKWSLSARVKMSGLLVEVEGYDGWPLTGVMRIGGEGRAARFEKVSGCGLADSTQVLYPNGF